MKKIFLLLFLIILCIGSTVEASDNLELFVFDQNKIDVGTLYYYTSVGVDDVTGEVCDYYIYISAENVIETLFTYKNPTVVYHYVLEYDWDYFMPKSREIKCLNPIEKIPSNFIISHLRTVDSFHDYYWQCEGRSRNKKGVINGYVEKTKFKRLPTFEKTTELAIGMKFFNQQKKKFEVGYYRSGLYFDLAGENLGQDIVNGVVCQKYKFTGKGLLAAMFGKNFYIWIANDEPCNIVKIADFNDAGSYYPNGQVLELEWAKKVSMEDWVALIESEKEKI